jgi:predicted PurR-regulated permease PerM
MASMPSTRDLSRVTLSIVCIGTLIAVSIWILLPFLLSIIWATMIVVATWPLMLRLQKRLWGKRGLAVAVMTAVLLMVFFVPVLMAVGTIVQNADMIAGWAKSLRDTGLPPAPGWIGGLPLVGPRLAAGWQELASAGPEGLTAKAAPYVGRIVNWFVEHAGSFGLMIVQFLLTVIISVILFLRGETAAEGVLRFARWLGGRSGEEVTVLAAKAVRGIALGVGLTALVQAALGGIGLAAAGVPAVTVLTVVMFILALAQLGVFLVLVPAAVWLYWKGHTAWAAVLLVWAFVVGTLDNLMRPILIKKGVDLSLLLIFAGVVGGLIAFGVIGIFIGPVVLAVTRSILSTVVNGDRPEALTQGSDGT